MMMLNWNFFYGVALRAVRENRESVPSLRGRWVGGKKGEHQQRLRVKIIIRENPGWWKFCVALWKHTKKKTPRLSIFSRPLFAERKWLNYMPAAISLGRLKRRAGKKSCCKFRALISSFHPFRISGGEEVERSARVSTMRFMRSNMRATDVHTFLH